jgi:hypothetical protein
MQLAVVVAVPGDPCGVDNRPIRHISKETVGVIFQIFGLDERGGQPQAFGIGYRPIPFLYGVAAAKRCPAAAMHQLPANVEVLVDDDHGRAQVPRPDGGMQPHTPRPKDNHVGFVIPLNGLSAVRGLLRQRRS